MDEAREGLGLATPRRPGYIVEGFNLDHALVMKKTDPKLDAWKAARKRHRLSHAHVQMARELGLNPAKLGKIDNHHQEPWKAPLPELIESLYEKRFGRLRPEKVLSLEDLARERARKEEARREAKAQRRLARDREQKPAAEEKPAADDDSGEETADAGGNSPKNLESSTRRKSVA